MLKERIDQDLKKALLSGDQLRVLLLRGLKSVIGYAEVEKGLRGPGLDDPAILAVLSKEAKKRQESADLYIQGGDSERASKELEEKKIIEAYLPAQLRKTEISAIIDKIIAANSPVSIKDLGRIIGGVRAQTAGTADGAIIAQLVKEKLDS